MAIRKGTDQSTSKVGDALQKARQVKASEPQPATTQPQQPPQTQPSQPQQPPQQPTPQQPHTSPQGNTMYQQPHQQQSFNHQQNHSNDQTPRRGLLTGMSQSLSRHINSDQITKYMAIFQQIIDNTATRGNDAKRLRLLPLESKNTGLALSCLLVIYESRHEGVDYKSTFALILEGSYNGSTDSAGNLLPEMNVEFFRGQQGVPVQKVAGDLVSDQLWGTIASYLKDTFGDNIKVLEAGNMAIPHEVKVDGDDIPMDHLNRIIFFAAQAVQSTFESETRTQSYVFSAADFDPTQDQINARLAFNTNPHGGQARNARGLPIRSDVRVTIEYANQATGGFNADPLSQRNATELTTLDTFVDLAYEPLNPQPVQTGWGNVAAQQQQSTIRYRPRIVVTRADTDVDVISMELMLLGLASSALMLVNDSWTRCFKPNPSTEGVDFKDIGAVGYEVNVTGDPTRTRGEAIPTKSAEFQNDPTALMTLLSMVMHHQPIVSMDIDEAGELSWIHETWLAAADGNDKALKRIVAAANRLTSDHFTQVFVSKGGNPHDPASIVRDEHVRIHTGYYVANGVPRDIRDVDYLAVLNKAGPVNDMRTLEEFSNTFEQTGMPENERAARRLDIIRETVGSPVRVTGYARRLTFNAIMLESILEGVSRAGMPINANHMQYEQTNLQVRGGPNGANYSNMAFSSGVTANMFNTYSPQQNGGAQYNSYRTSFHRQHGNSNNGGL